MTKTIPNVPRELKPCPFCGGEADPKGWMSSGGAHGPACDSCGATANSADEWNARAPAPAVCKWTYNEDDCFYSTQCGSHWHYSEGGTPDEHGQLFCHACGKQVDDTRGEDCE